MKKNNQSVKSHKVGNVWPADVCDRVQPVAKSLSGISKIISLHRNAFVVIHATYNAKKIILLY